MQFRLRRTGSERFAFYAYCYLATIADSNPSSPKSAAPKGADLFGWDSDRETHSVNGVFKEEIRGLPNQFRNYGFCVKTDIKRLMILFESPGY